ncbi:hypothetical protein VW23_027450 [Devosia insulae DS-56]|uniref:Uncharacterized protein n=1 Tax=Devosia insulae DS-56 TaxID=1116389 RepID=A0A1E5XKF8_9HYPH|nr:hypothetical protein VW23_027450 [Devosia insulae DS-56]
MPFYRKQGNVPPIHIEVTLRRNDQGDLVGHVYTRGGLPPAPADDLSPAMALQIASDMHLRTLSPVFVLVADQEWSEAWGPLEVFEPPARPGVVASERPSDDPPIIE